MDMMQGLSYRKIVQATGFALALAATGHIIGNARAAGDTAQSVTQSEISTRWSVPASRLIGMEVENRQGEQLGEVIDLIIDASTDEVEYAILSFGGVLNLGDKLFAYPLERFDRTAARDENKLVLNVSEERLEEAPGFDRSAWPDFNRSEYRDQIHRHYGTLPSSSDTRYVRASLMMDGDVKNARGDDIGDIHDLAIDMVHGSVHYVVLEFEDAWVARGAELVAVPMQGLRADDADGDLVYPADREMLSEAPSFDEDRWPEIISSGDFQLDLDQYSNEWSSAAAT